MSTAPVKPLIVPEPYSGVGSWEEWIDHFESAAAVSQWEDADKLLWLKHIYQDERKNRTRTCQIQLELPTMRAKWQEILVPN